MMYGAMMYKKCLSNNHNCYLDKAGWDYIGLKCDQCKIIYYLRISKLTKVLNVE